MISCLFHKNMVGIFHLLLQRLLENKLSVAAEKSEFHSISQLFGFVASHGQTEPDQSKIEANSYHQEGVKGVLHFSAIIGHKPLKTSESAFGSKACITGQAGQHGPSRTKHLAADIQHPRCFRWLFNQFWLLYKHCPQITLS